MTETTDPSLATPQLPHAGASGGLPSPPRTSRAARVVIITLTLLLVLLPILWVAVPHEVARWYLAAALDASMDAHPALAVSRMDGAIRWDGADPELYLHRARWKLDAGDHPGALDDCHRALKLAADPGDALMQRTLVFQRMGRHDEALADWDQMVDRAREAVARNERDAQAQAQLAVALNNRAYACALAHTRLEQGLADIQEALQMPGHQEDYVLLDTRGFLLYLAGDLPRAREDLDAAVTLAQAEYARHSARSARLMRQMIDPRPVQEALKHYEHNLAVICHHRGLVYQDLGLQDQADRDLKRARELGYNPQAGVW